VVKAILLSFVSLLFGVLTYVAGIVSLIPGFFLFRWVGLLRLIHWERFSHGHGGVLAVANHPSILDVFILPLLFYWGFILHPFRRRPRIVADANNFYNSPWFWFWARPFMIPVKRGNPRSEVLAENQISAVLKQGGVVILFPERGRSHKARNRIAVNGVVLGEFSKSVGRIAVEVPNLTIVPLCIKGSKEALANEEGYLVGLHRVKLKPVRIAVGTVLRFTKEERVSATAVHDITQKVFDEICILAKENF